MDSLNTVLNDRILWYDGESSYDPTQLLRLVTRYDVKHVTHKTHAVSTYNKHVPRDQEITVKMECGELSPQWVLPDEYKNLDVVEYVFDKHYSMTLDVHADEADARDSRLAQELELYQKFNLFDVLRTIVWIINTFTEKDVVWGVGRGSSVSSYVLYVVGVHDVDSFAYDLDIDDFLHS